MNEIWKYIIIFLLFSNLGWIYECIILNKFGRDTLIKKISDMNIPIFSVYGVAGVVLYFIYSNFKYLTLIEKVLLAAIILNILECISGQLSYLVNGYKTWDYTYNFKFVLCDGYVSLETAIWWTFLITIVFIIFDWLKI